MQIAQHDVQFLDGAGVRGVIHLASLYEYIEAVDGAWDAQFIQLSPGPLNANVQYLASDRFMLYRESWEQRIHTLGTLRPGLIALGIPEARGGPAIWWGRELPRGHLPYAHQSRALDLITEPGEAITVLVLEETLLRRIVASLCGAASDDFQWNGRLLKSTPAAMIRLQSAWNRMLRTASGDAYCNLTLPDIVAPLVDALQLPLDDRHGDIASSHVFEAVMAAAERSDFRVSVPDLSVRLRIGRRTIECAFRRRLGISPQAYFAKRRLSRCYHELIEADPATTTVAAVAMRHGFTELGRFAASYRRHYGELPSQSLQRSSPGLSLRCAGQNTRCRPSRAVNGLPADYLLKQPWLA